MEWIVDSYALVFAGLVLVGGSLADRCRRKRFCLVGLTVFAAASIVAAFSGSVSLLIISRVIMGVGAALTMPSALSTINDVFRDPTERTRALGAWAGAAGLGVALGPIVGGLLLAKFWWGSVFLVNVPIASAAFVGALVLVPDSKNPIAERPDPAGAVLSIAGLGLLLWAIIEAPTRGWTSAIVVGAGLASLAVLGAFIAWEARSRQPTLELEFFRDRHFSLAALGESLGVFGLMGVLFVQTQFLQFDLGFSSLQAGRRSCLRPACWFSARRCLLSSSEPSGPGSPRLSAWRRSRELCGRSQRSRPQCVRERPGGIDVRGRNRRARWCRSRASPPTGADLATVAESQRRRQPATRHAGLSSRTTRGAWRLLRPWASRPWF